MSRLAQVALGTKLKKPEAKEQRAQAQQRLVHLRLLLGGQIGPKELGPPLLVLFEGWDASGKGGAIKRLTERLDPRHCRVRSFSAPTYDEKRHHFLWRVLPGPPRRGGVARLDPPRYRRGVVGRGGGDAPA